MRFSLRDLFWITVVVAMGLEWWVQSRNCAAELAVTKKHRHMLIFFFEARTHDTVRLGKDGRVDIEERPAARDSSETRAYLLNSQAPAANPPKD